MNYDERMAELREMYTTTDERWIRTMGTDSLPPENNLLDEVFKLESDEDLLALHIRQMGGCPQCERGSTYDFTDR